MLELAASKVADFSAFDRLGAPNDRTTRVFRLYMDMLILIRASYFIGNPASTFSGNIARVRSHSLGTDSASNILATASEKCLGVS